MPDEVEQARELEARARVLEERLQNARRHRREPEPSRAWVPFTIPFLLLASGGLLGYGLIRRAGIEKSDARRCENGELSVCAAAAYNLAHAHYEDRDSKRAERLDKQACEAGLGAACTRMGDKDDKLVLRGCLQGDARSCTKVVSTSVFHSELGDDDGRKAVAWKLACDGGDADGCLALAEELGNGAYTSDADANYLKLLRRGCDLGGGKSCKRIGDSLMHKKDRKGAYDMYKLGCDKKYRPACDKLKERTIEEQKL